MLPGNSFRHLVLQQHPSGGLIVRFRSQHLNNKGVIRQVNEELQSLVAPERLILIDFSSVEYLGSPIIGKLIGIQRQLREKCGNIALCGMRPRLEEVFRICNLDRIFNIYTDLESALSGEQTESS